MVVPTCFKCMDECLYMCPVVDECFAKNEVDIEIAEWIRMTPDPED